MIAPSSITNSPLGEIELIIHFFLASSFDTSVINQVQLLFFSNFNDFTNAFKIYRKVQLLKIFPLKSEKFDIFLEIPLKFYIKKNSFDIIPINWTGRKKGISKFVIKELSFNYFKTLFKCFIRIN